MRKLRWELLVSEEQESIKFYSMKERHFLDIQVGDGGLWTAHDSNWIMVF